MKQVIWTLLAFTLVACGASSKDSTQKNPNIGKVQYALDPDHETYFVAVVDTGLDYHLLRNKMVKLSRDLHIAIDTMGRSFDKNKDLIVLADNDPDEMYAGKYLPRRYPSGTLSLEYLGFYDAKAKEKTIAIIAGIYETQKSADSAMVVLSKKEKNSFKIKARIFVGCMH